MKKVRAAIVGYGNIGHFVLEALQAAPDFEICLLYTSPSPRDRQKSRMPSSA